MFNKIYEKIKTFIVENYKSLLLIIAVVLLFQIELPYIIYKPGGSINLNDRVLIEDKYETKGSLEMAYVSVVKGSVPFLLMAKILPDWDIASKDDITSADESIKDVLEKDKIYLNEAIDNATIVAYNLAGKEIAIDKVINNVMYITEEANTTLKVYDQIIEVEETVIKSLDDLKNVVNTFEENDIINIKVIRNKKKVNATAKVYNTTDGLKIGVSLVNTYELTTNPQIEVKTKSSESGPSGGLMTALSIYNALVEEDITRGKKIIGTGTIDKNGTVGEIGGVKYKLMGAVKKKADVFLCPEKNYEEAIKIAKEKDYDIEIVSVKTINDAIVML